MFRKTPQGRISFSSTIYMMENLRMIYKTCVSLIVKKMFSLRRNGLSKASNGPLSVAKELVTTTQHNNSNLFRNGKKKRLNIAGINPCKNKVKVQREK